MSFGRIALVAAGALAGATVVYAASRSENVRALAVASVRAGLKAKDWTVGKYEKAKGEMQGLVEEAKKVEKTA